MTIVTIVTTSFRIINITNNGHPLITSFFKFMIFCMDKCVL